MLFRPFFCRAAERFAIVGGMRLGFFTQPVHPPSRDHRRALRQDREAILLADRLGYCEAFVGERLADHAEPVASCLTLIASLANDAKRIAFGSQP